MQTAQAVVRQERVGVVAVLVLANPPVNALSGAVRAGLSAGLAAALADPAVRAIVIRGEGRGFCAGADIGEFGALRQGPRLADLCDAIENAGKPVVAAVHGMALGGGLELALAAHYRVAQDAAVLGLPEVNLGIVPGAGGTQRLPRLIGASAALRMMLTGVPVKAAEAVELGLVDRIVGAGVVEAALALAAETPPPRPTSAMRRGLQDGRAYLAQVAEARVAQAGNRLPAPGRIVELVEAALLFPLVQGLAAEAAAFGELVATPEAAGLRHAFFVERRALQLPVAVQGGGVPVLAALGIWGLGSGAVDLCCQALTSGLRVVLASTDRPGLVAALDGVAAWQNAAVAAGRMSEAARDADWARLVSAAGSEGLSGCDLILQTAEAATLAAGAIPVARIGAAGPGAEAAITVATAGAGGLAELGLTRAARPEVVGLVVALARRLNWRLVPVGPGGPVEWGLRQALAGAMLHLGHEGIAEGEAAAALAIWALPRGAGGIAPTLTATDRRVVDMALAAMAAEGLRMVEDGRVRRPLEVDAVAMVAGLVPRWEGGPMFQADRRGLLLLRRDLIDLAEGAPLFLPPALIDRLIADGKPLASLN